MRSGPGGLFSGSAIPDEARRGAEEALAQVKRSLVETLLANEVDTLIDGYLAEFGEVVLRWDDVTMSEPAPIEVIAGRNVFGEMVRLAQVQSTIRVPVRGDPLLLTYRSHQGAPMGGLAGLVTPTGLELTRTGDTSADGVAIVAWVVAQKEQVERFLIYNNSDVMTVLLSKTTGKIMSVRRSKM